MKSLFIATLAIFIYLNEMSSQDFQRIADINPGSGSSVFDEYNVVIEFDGKLFFTANDGTHGYEVWVYDGSEASLLKDIYSGPGHSNAQNYFLVAGRILFTAQDGANGMEWWSTDGTEEGTQLVKDVFPGATGGVFTAGNNRKYFHLYNDEVYFTGAHRSNDYELWKTNGTSTGTVQVKNIAVDGFGNFSSFPEDFAEHNGSLYFSSNEGFWKTNGTTSGTILVEDEDPEDPFGLDPEDLVSSGEYLLFIQNSDLWRSDGTSIGTMKIKDLEYVNLNWFGNRFSVLDNVVLFPGADIAHGEELWATDGTQEGTRMVVDLNTGPDGYAPQNNVVFNNRVYYKGDDGNSGIEFWSSDGTAAGTQLVKDIVPGSSTGFYLPTELFIVDEHIFMNAGDSFDKELWISNGTTLGTYQLDINLEGQSSPAKFSKYGDNLFLFASAEEFGAEPCILDFTMTSAIEHQNFKNSFIYPNPTSGIVHFTPNNTDIHYTLIDISGFQYKFEEISTIIDLSYLAPGQYYIASRSKSTGVITYEKIILITPN